MERVEDIFATQVRDRPQGFVLSDSTGKSWANADLEQSNAALRARLTGLRPGMRVVIVLENCGATLSALLAIWQAGGVAVPVNARQSPREIDRVIAHAEPAVTWFTSEVSPAAMAHAERLQAELLRGPFGQMHELRHPQPSEGLPNDIAVLLYTTGTTGDPKGVMLSHGNLIYSGRSSVSIRGMSARDLIYGVLPMTHVFGLCSIAVAALCCGAGLRLVPRFDAAQAFEELRSDITLFSAVPQMHALIMAHAKAVGRASLGSGTLRFVSSGAAPLDPTWKREAEAFYGVAVQNGYGMTEASAGSSVTSNPLGSPDISVGQPFAGTEIRIDEEVAGGGDGLGEVLVRGPGVMRGYFRAPDETAKVLDADGWLHTGDLGTFDDQGRLHIRGRSKELIIRGGFNVYPPEVEAALNDHPEIVQAAVIGRRVAGDEEVLAFCQVRPECTLTEADLRAFLEPRLAGYKRPAHIVFAEQLPAAPTGKILKHKLLETLGNRLP